MADPVRTAERFTADLSKTLGDELRSVLLYGSVPRGEAIAGVSDINILVLLDEVRLARLVPLAPLARRWTELGNTAPLILGWDEWGRSADVFAVEIADMLDHHRVLLGDDPLAGVRVQPRALRLQTERELRGKLVQLHEGLLLSATEPEAVGALLLRALPSFTAYFRATLRLAGRPVPPASDDVIAGVAALVGGDGSGMGELWRARTGGRTPRLEATDGVVEGYHALVRRVTEYVDSLAEGKDS